MIPDSSETPEKPNWLPRLAALAGCLYFLLHGIRVLFGSENKVMEWLYDDAFYYLITAKHFSAEHMSSFDGVTVTSGYHPLWMWLCALLYGVRGHLDLTYVRSCMALAFAISASMLALALRCALRRRDDGLLWALALAGCSYSALNNGLTIMEWPLVVLSWFLLHRLLISKVADPASSPGYVAAFLIGILGSLSRTDFGLIPASYFAAAVVLAMRGGPRSSVRRAFLATAGSAAGLALVFVYNRRMTGDWLQGSAQVKHLAASLSTPFNPVGGLWQFVRVLFYLPALDLDLDLKTIILRRIFLILLTATLVLASVLVSQRSRLRTMLSTRRPHTPAEKLALVASLFGIAGYLVLDGFNTQATYGWYTASVTGFVLIVTARLFAMLTTTRAAVLVFPLLVLNIVAAEHFGGNARSQMQELASGKALLADHPGAVMAGGDVGKPSFYNHGTMFNLDGLMNNEVVPYLASGTIHCYILRRHIQYLSDIGSITGAVTNAERTRFGKPPLPWLHYFSPVYPTAPDGSKDTNAPVLYYIANLDAIRASGECPATN